MVLFSAFIHRALAFLLLLHTACLANDITKDCAKKNFWNDTVLNTYTFHLKINAKNNFVLHSTVNPLDKGIVLEFFKENARNNLDNILLNVFRSGANLIAKVFALTGTDGKTLSAVQHQFPDLEDAKNEESPNTDPFITSVKSKQFHDAFRITSERLYSRVDCLFNSKNADVKATMHFCEKCTLGSGNNCIHDTLINQLEYIIPENVSSELGRFVTSVGCNLFFEKKNVGKDDDNRMIVYSMLKSSMQLNKQEVNLSVLMPSCYKVKGYQFQVIPKDWLSNNYTAECDTIPIEKYPPRKQFDVSSATVVESHGILFYVGIAVAVIVVLVILAALYLYFFSDDEVDEFVPEGQTPGVPGATTEAPPTGPPLAAPYPPTVPPVDPQAV